MFVLGTLFLVVHHARLWYSLRHVPGPFLASISDLWMLRVTLSGHMWREFGGVCEKYGPVARVGPNEIIIDDPEAVRGIMAARSQYTKSNWYSAFRFNPERDNILTQLDNKIHDRLRSKMITGYSGRENLGLEITIDTHLNELTNLVSTKYISTSSILRPLDIARTVQYFTLDVITHLGFGQEFGFLAADADVYDYIETTTAALPLMSILSTFPRLQAVMRSYLVKKYILPSEKDPAGLGQVIRVAKSILTERYKPDAKDEKDMLGSFIRHGLSQEEAEAEVLLQIVAGSDTTATAIRMTLLHLITSPSTYAKLRNEIFSVSLSNPVRDSEAMTLPYLQAVIKEGLRMYPPISSVMFKHSPPSGDVIAGIRIPGGTKVGLCWYGISRNKESYGKDSQVFRPERWLEAEGEALERMERTNDLIFSPGRWGCLGKGLALMTLNKVFVELLRRFDFQVIDPSRPIKSFNMGAFVQSDMWVRVTEYEEGSEQP